MTTFADIPRDLVPCFMQHLDHQDRAIIACVSRDLRQYGPNTNALTRFLKFQVVVNDMLLSSKTRQQPPITIAFNNRQGYVLFTLIRDSSGRLYYKLDGGITTPKFAITQDSIDMFFKFVMREIQDIMGFEIYTTQRGASTAAYFWTLEKRLISAFN